MSKKNLLTIVLWCLAVVSAVAADQFVDFRHGDWKLNKDGRITIYVSPQEERGVMLAARNLKTGASAGVPLGNGSFYWATSPNMPVVKGTVQPDVFIMVVR
jgi:hypothetical protein